MILKLIGILLLAGGCVSPFAALQRFKDNGRLLEEIRTEIADLKHSIHTTDVELRLLEEKLENQTSSETGYLKEEIAALEKKVGALEKKQDKDTKERVHQIESLDHKIGDIDQIKGALSSLSKYVATKQPPTHQVQPGDSLSKIAKTYGLSVANLKTINHLEGDKILVGQVLMLSNTHASER